MSIMMEKLHKALLAAGANDDDARAAAVEAAEQRTDIADIKATLRLHTWMSGLNSAGLVIILGKLFAG